MAGATDNTDSAGTPGSYPYPEIGVFPCGRGPTRLATITGMTEIAAGNRRLRVARGLLVAGTVAIVLLQILALPVRNPFTRTMSSYEYTWAGWLFPAGLVVFGSGLLLLGWHVPARHRFARWALLAAAVGAAATAVFPSGTGHRDEALWPGEVHRWGSIALVVGVLTGALMIARTALSQRSRRTIGLLILSALVSAVLFLSGQLATAPQGVLGYAPWAGGLSQRILIGLTVAATLQVVALLAGTAPSTSPDVVGTGHDGAADHAPPGAAPLQP